MINTKIEWCDHTWNPVWGCKNSCPYCYARKTAQRFGESFEPHWKEKNFQRGMPKEPSRIFVNSMSDIAFWKMGWADKVLRRIEEYPQHTFLFLTKVPDVYELYKWPDNCWLGVTITNQDTMNYFADLIFEIDWNESNKIFFSFEPILEKIEIYVNPDWLIVGAETGNRKDKIIPQREWIEELIMQTNVPIFMKDSLIPIWNENLIRQFPQCDI